MFSHIPVSSMTRLLHSSAVALALFLFACEKKSEPSNAEKASGPEHATKRPRPDLPKPPGNSQPKRNNDPDAKLALQQAYETALQEADPVAREKAISAVALDAVEADPELARKALADLTPGSEESKKLTSLLATRLAGDNPDVALEWARSLEQPTVRDDAMSRVAVAISTDDPKRAITLATNSVPEGILRDRTLVQIARHWSQSAPPDAAVWVASLPAGNARRYSVQYLSDAWSEIDPRAFAKWASTQKSLLPEVASAVSASLHLLPNEEARTKRLDSFGDGPLRQLVDEQLAKAPK